MGKERSLVRQKMKFHDHAMMFYTEPEDLSKSAHNIPK